MLVFAKMEDLRELTRLEASVAQTYNPSTREVAGERPGFKGCLDNLSPCYRNALGVTALRRLTQGAH